MSEPLRRESDEQVTSQSDEAVQVNGQAIGGEGDHGPGLLQLARLELASGRPQTAAEYARRLADLEPGSGQVRHDLALFLNELGQLEAAYTQMKEAARLCPRSPEILNNLGALLAQLGRGREAINVYRKAVRLSPSVALLRLNLAEALQAAGMIQENILELRIASTLDPNLQRPGPRLVPRCWLMASPPLRWEPFAAPSNSTSRMPPRVAIWATLSASREGRTRPFRFLSRQRARTQDFSTPGTGWGRHSWIATATSRPSARSTIACRWIPTIFLQYTNGRKPSFLLAASNRRWPRYAP